MSFISFNYNKNLRYAFVYWFVEIIMRSIIYLDWDFFHVFQKDSSNEYFFIILQNISDLIAGFFVIYIYFSVQKKPNQDYSDIASKKSGIELILEERKVFTVTKNFIVKIIIICFLDYINRSPFFIFYQTNPEAEHNDISHKAQFDIINHMDIIARFILSIVILKTKVFKHHILSLIIILIGFIILIPYDAILLHLNPNGADEKLTYIYIGIFSFKGILFPLEDIIQKKVFTENYIFPEHLMFIRGVGEMIIIFIVTPILYYTIWINDPELLVLSSNLRDIILLSIFYVSCSCIKTYVLLKVIYYFSAQSVSFLIISESITGSIATIINFFKSSEQNYVNIIFLIIDIIIILITSFGTLVYNEIIVIKKWGLDLYVTSEITKRALLETNRIKDFDDYDDDDDDEEEKHTFEMNEIYE